MNILIRDAIVTDPRSGLNGKKVDILIHDGIIREIGESIEAKGVEVYSAENLHVSPGWLDMRVNVPDPGHEYKENFVTACRAAAAGGVTAFACTATSTPPRDSKAGIEYVINRTRTEPVSVYPYGTLSEARQGKDIAELYDMFSAGAVAFSDDKKPITDTGLLARALQYCQRFNGLVCSFPFDKSLAGKGQVNEGIVSTSLGLKGIPAEAEEIAVTRDLHVLRFTGGRLHFATISSEGSVEIIKAARHEKLNVSAEVASHQLLLTDDSLQNFETEYKVLPPLRTASHCRALAEGIASGVIEVIVSDHTPEDVEEKVREFETAAYGAIGLQTMFSAARTATDGVVPLDRLIECISINPARLLNISLPEIKQGETANLTLFDPDKKFIFEKEMVLSKSKNTPFAGMELKGVPLAIYSKGKFLKI